VRRCQALVIGHWFDIIVLKADAQAIVKLMDDS
jgi:hypothetical protein